MMTGTKFDIKKFNRMNNFGLWQVRMKALLEQQRLAAALEELPTTTIVAYDNSQSEHIDEFHKLIGDLTAIDTAISEEDHALLLLTSLSLSYDNFMETLLYGRDTLKLEDVLATLNSRELQKMTEANRYSAGYNHKKSQGFVRNRNQVSGSEADGGSYHITYMIDFLVDFEEYDGGNILLDDGRECRVRGTCKVQVHTRDGSSFMLDNVRSRLLVVLSETRRASCVYTLDGHVVTKKTLKGRKQLGEYQTLWKIKMGNVLDFFWSVQGSLGRGNNHCYISSEQGMLELVMMECIFLGYRKGIVANKALEVRVQFRCCTELSLRWNLTCEVFLKWKAGLKDDMDARSDVYVLSNGCKKCKDDSDDYYWEYTPDRQRLEWGDYDVEKNGKYSCIYAVGSQEYQMVYTRLDIASAHVGMLDKFDRGLQTDVQFFVDFDYAMRRSITVMGRSIISEVYDTYRSCKGGYLTKRTRNRVRIQAKDSSGYCYRCIVKGYPWSEVPAYVEFAEYR
ncbi:hypothetical protein Tco_0255014 [Tanacetum coccineum]